jgi:hypothetical protein
MAKGLKPWFGPDCTYFQGGGKGPVAFIPRGENILYMCNRYVSDVSDGSYLDDQGVNNIASGMKGVNVARFGVKETIALVPQKPDFPGDVKKPKKQVVRSFYRI